MNNNIFFKGREWGRYFSKTAIKEKEMLCKCSGSKDNENDWQ
jgi:hypothetical protein